MKRGGDSCASLKTSREFFFFFLNSASSVTLPTLRTLVSIAIDSFPKIASPINSPIIVGFSEFDELVPDLGIDFTPIETLLIKGAVTELTLQPCSSRGCSVLTSPPGTGGLPEFRPVGMFAFAFFFSA